MDQAYELYDQGQLEKAITILNDNEASNDPRYFFLRGSCYSELGENALAVQDFNKAIQLQPKWPEAFYQRGFSYFAAGQSRLAIQDFDQTILQDSTYAEAYLNRGSVYYDLGNEEEACINWLKASQLGLELATQLTGQLCP